MSMAPRCFLPLRKCIFSVGNPAPPRPSHDHLASPLSCFLPFVSRAVEWYGHRYFSSIPNQQEVGVSETKWHELPPVPKQGFRWTAWELNNASKNSTGSDLGDEENARENVTDYGPKQITALQWVTKCCPTLPNSLLHKLFRVRQVRQRILLPKTEHKEQPSDAPGSQELVSRMRRVSLKAVLEEGSVLYLPKSVFQYEADMLHGQNFKKTQHQPTASEVTLLKSLVLYKDAEILVINKPPGLPVQGGSQIKRSLDSLMGSALSFDRHDGPRLVHRLDKETSGLMILARTQECATFLHTLFRDKTATAREAENDNTSIKRVYSALVIGTPKKTQGRISVPLMKFVLDEGRGDKIMVCHDFSSENAQVAITDYKVVGPSLHGCTWLELCPLTGRKHQLRVHCAEVLGTPVFGDMKYGWRTQKEWLRKMSSQDAQSFAFEESSEYSEGKTTLPEQHVKAVKGSILSSVPLLHLHCGEMIIPNVLQKLETHGSRLSRVDENNDWLQFFAPLPSHMGASRSLWAPNISAESHETVERSRLQSEV